jgi:hypothetical protein
MVKRLAAVALDLVPVLPDLLAVMAQLGFLRRGDITFCGNHGPNRQRQSSDKESRAYDRFIVHS